MARSRRDRGNILPGVYLAMAGLAAVIVFPSALRPPADEATTAAEFSPDAPPEEQPEAIIQSLEQAVSRTAGATGQDLDEVEDEGPPPTTTTTTIVRAPVRNACFGDPPRQIEAIYAPGCAPAFVGDNGGETYPGIDENEIRISFSSDLSGPLGGDECGEINETAVDGESGAMRTYRVLRDYFNSTLELYGRQLRFFYACPPDGQSGVEAEKGRAIVAKQEFDSFGVIGEFNQGLPTEAARLKMAYLGNVVVAGDSWYAERAPYVWGSRAHSTRAVDMSSEYLCRRLHGNLPFPTGDRQIDYESPRTYGILALSDASTAESVADMQTQMKEKCGAEPEVVAEYNLDDNVQGLSTAMLQLSTARVSTIIFMGEILTLPTQAELANQQDYFPEWYTMGAGGFETSILLARTISPRQWQNAFGFSFEEIPRRPRSTSCYRAYRSIDPENDPNSSVCEILWHSMLFMFGAMQEAGPNLNIDTWTQAMQTAFTRPATPEWSMSGGFSPIDYTYGDFAVELYWDPLAEHPDGNPGAYIYLNNGIRFLAEDIPTGQPEFFQGGITDGDNAGPDGNAFN